MGWRSGGGVLESGSGAGPGEVPRRAGAGPAGEVAGGGEEALKRPRRASAARFRRAAERSCDERHPHIPPLATWKAAGVATVAAGEGSRGFGGGSLGGELK